MVVYVDDFKLAGPAKNLAAGWALIRSKIKTDPPHPVDIFLGCKHTQFTRKLPDTGVQVRGIEYDLSDFLVSCVDRYKDLAKVTVMRRASTPFLAEHSKPDLAAARGVPEVELDPDVVLRALQEVADTGYSLQSTGHGCRQGTCCGPVCGRSCS